MNKSLMTRYRVKPGSKASLSGWDPSEKKFAKNKKEGIARLAELSTELDRLQDVLYAERKHKILVVLQGMDTSGKDGTIRHVFNSVDPLGVRVASFKVPTEEESDHDFLWRIHRQVPGRGEITIFNRSHYEDVLVVRVHKLVADDIWKARYDQINSFERMLTDSGSTIVKFYLHIDRDEQKARLEARLADPTKRWKFRKGDLDDRALWSEYEKAYNEAISRTSTKWAPWYVIPANSKWYRNLVIAEILTATLSGLDMNFPEPEEDLDAIVIE